MRAVRAVSVAVVLALLGLLVWDSAHGSGGGIAPKVDRGETVAAPALRLPSFGPSGDLSLASYRGKVVVVNFWATWCAPCREEMPALQRVAASEPDVVFLEVDLMEPADRARSFLDSLGLDRLQPVFDSDGATTRRFGVLSLPSTFFVDKDGVIRHLELAQMTEERIRNGIRKAR